MSGRRTVTVLAVEVTADDASLEQSLLRLGTGAGGELAVATGGSFALLFSSALDAVRTAARFQQEADRQRRLGRQSHVRTGLAVGEVEPSSVESYPTYRTAVALRDAAELDEIVIDDLTQRLVQDTDIEVIERPGDPAAAHVRWQPAPAATRVVIADDAALIRSGIARLLGDAGFDVIAEVADADALLAAVAAEPPDLVVTDVRMPPGERDVGLRAAATVRAEHPETAVLVLSQYIEARSATALLDDRRAGVGYLLKERVGNVDEFLDACRTVVAGGRIVDPMVADELLRNRRQDDPVERLSERERDVLSLMSQGRSNAAIAAQLAISAKTLEAHVRSIFTKLDLPESPDDHRRVTAVIAWLQRTA